MIEQTKIKTLEEAILDLKQISTGTSSAFYMTWTRLRLENGDPSYYPAPQELIDILGYRTTSSLSSVIRNLQRLNLIPLSYKYKSSTTFFDHQRNEVKIGDSGIYCIKASTGVYIGLSKDMNARLRSHAKQIKKGTHRYIGREESPNFIILENVLDHDLLLEREAYWATKAINAGVNVFNEENFT